MIETRNNEIVTPCTSAFPTGPTVTNILLQNVCPLDQTDHIGIAADTVALHLVLNALDPAHPRAVPCVLPGAGADVGLEVWSVHDPAAPGPRAGGH